MNRKLDWAKGGGLIPAVVQDSRTARVLMVGWMNRAALAKTRDTGLVTFFSRSKKRLWTKGESSGDVLKLVSISADCDGDTLLVQALPAGPACHKGTTTCFDGKTEPVSAGDEFAFLQVLEATVAERFKKKPRGSYVAGLIAAGPDRMAQKVGEEAVETVIASKNKDKALLESEAADLLFHLMVLLQAKGSSLSRVARTLRVRHGAARR
jgi:phosphoribosyl-ATP pyrophosphohydrolase/phosphoribosyl-AMP cyclohydrolase